MSNTFKKTSLRGFTLIELLVVIAIIGLLSTVIAAPITQARKKGRDGKKVADLHQLVGALQQYADDHVGNYATTTGSLVPIYLATLPPFSAVSAAPKDKYMYVVYETTTGGDIRQVGFHMGVKLEAPNLALGDDRDCAGWGTITSGDNYCIDSNADSGLTLLAVPGNFTAANPPTTFANDAFGMAGGPANTQTAGTVGDFQGGADTASTTCTALFNGVAAGPAGACVYDITN